jgi:translation initiation factor 2A
MADAGGGSPVPPSGPVLNVAYRCKEACGIKAGPMQNSDGSHSVGADDLFVLPPNTKEIVYSGNGSHFLTLLEDSVVVWSCETFQLLSSISRRGIVAAAFSPLGTFIQTWEKVSEASTSAGGNLQIWLAATGQRVAALNVGAVFSKENWPVLQWSRDEAVAARMAPDSVIFFDGTAIDRGVVRSVSVPSITRFSLSPALPYRFATFVPEKKGNPSRFSIFDYPSCDAPICSKTHFRASYADFFWNSKGDSLLVKTSVDVDVTGQSYYGGSDIFFMNAAGTASMLAGVESPVYDCAWDPKGRYVFFSFFLHACFSHALLQRVCRCVRPHAVKSYPL